MSLWSLWDQGAQHGRLGGTFGLQQEDAVQTLQGQTDLVSKALHSHLDGLEVQMADLMPGDGNAIDLALQEMENKHKMLSAINSTVLFDLKKYYPKVFEATHERRKNMIRRVVIHNVMRGMEQGMYRDDLNVDAVADLHLALWRTWCGRPKTAPFRVRSRSISKRCSPITSAASQAPRVGHLESKRLKLT